MRGMQQQLGNWGTISCGNNVLRTLFFFALYFIKTQPFVKRKPVKTGKKYRNDRVPFQAGFTVCGNNVLRTLFFLYFVLLKHNPL